MIRPPWRPAGYQVRIQCATAQRTITSLRLYASRDNNATEGSHRQLRRSTDFTRRDHFSQARTNVSLRSPGTTYKTKVHPTILPFCSPVRRILRVHFGLGMAPARSHSTRESDGKPSEPTNPNNGTLKQRKEADGRSGADSHDGHEHDEHEHDHSHSHSIFGHSHSHGEEGHSHDAEQIIAALKGSNDRGSQITLVGLFSNIGLTATKGLAGWYLHSASLMADAGHSLSDLLGDFVTLFCWKLSRKPPSERYPYGFAKFETLGTTTISILLIGGALGIGFHSYHLLVVALGETAAHMEPSVVQELLQNLTSSAPIPHIGHSHVHSVDPNAAWFAAMGVLTKEYLYRITKVVADEEKSPVLLANAIHHRSDAYSSLVAFFAILGTWLFPAFPLDPVGGLVVSIVILQQGYSLLRGAWGDLTDAGASPRTKASIQKVLQPLIVKDGSKSSTASTDNIPPLLDISHLRARRAGSMLFVDLTASVPRGITIEQATALDQFVTGKLKEAKKEVAEVRIKFESR